MILRTPGYGGVQDEPNLTLALLAVVVFIGIIGLLKRLIVEILLLPVRAVVWIVSLVLGLLLALITWPFSLLWNRFKERRMERHAPLGYPPAEYTSTSEASQ